MDVSWFDIVVLTKEGEFVAVSWFDTVVLSEDWEG